MLTKEQVSKLLNRTLTAPETQNFGLYINNAKTRLEALLGMSLENEHATRMYNTRQGYRTVFTDVFTTDVDAVVTVAGEVKDPATYTVRQFDNLNGTWFNSIVFTNHLDRSVDYISVEADFGFNDCLPNDLQLLLAKMFALNSTEQTADNRVSSKKIEDFTVSYRDVQTYDDLISTNQQVIDAYSIKDKGMIRNGHLHIIY